MAETWNANIPVITNVVADDIEDINQNFAYLMARNGYLVDSTEADQGAAGSGNSVKDLVDAIGATKQATLFFPHLAADGDTTTYTLLTAETIPANIKLCVQNGAQVQPAAGVSLTVYSPANIIAPLNQQIIDATNNSTNPILFTTNGVVSPYWFGDVDGTADEVQVLSTVNSLAGTGKGIIDLLGGSYTIADEVLTDVSDLTIKNGVISSTASYVFRTRNASGFAASVAVTGAITIGDEDITVNSTATYTAGDYISISAGKTWGLCQIALRESFARIKTVTDGTTLKLEQAVIDSYALVDSPVIKLLTPIENIVIEDIDATGSSATGNEYFVRFDMSSNVKVQRCSIKKFGSAAITFENTIHSSATHNYIQDSDRSGFGYGVQVQSSQWINVTDNVMERTTHGIVTGGAEAGWFPSRFLNFNDNIIVGPTKAMINAHGPTEFVVISNNVGQFPEASTNANGIEIFCPNAVITGNIINDPIEHGIVASTYASGSAGLHNYVIANNTINNAAASGAFDGIRVKPSVGVVVNTTITGNRIKTPRVGILLEASVASSEITESVIANNSVEMLDDGIQMITENAGNNVHNIAISGNTFDGDGGDYGVYIVGTGGTNSTADMIQITGNTFKDFTVGVGSISATVVDIGISGNVFDNVTTFVTLTSRRFQFSGNTPNQETATGTVTLNPYLSVSVIDSSGGAVTATLGNANMCRGFTKMIMMSDASNSSTLSVSNHETSDPEVFTFAQVDDTLVLTWTGSEWITVANSGVAT